MPFNASWVADPLDFDFRPFVDAHGTIPEPSTKSVDRFNRKWMALMAAGRAATGASIEFKTGDPLDSLLDQWAEGTAEESAAMKRLDEEIVGCVAEVCANKPTKVQINKLPNRQRRAFIAWVLEEMSNPKLNSGATPPRAAQDDEAPSTGSDDA